MKKKNLFALFLTGVLVMAGQVSTIQADPIPDPFASEENYGSLPIEGHKAIPLSPAYTPSAVDHMLNPSQKTTSLGSAFPASHNDPALLGRLQELYPKVRDQNPYGTCWAHGAIGSVERNMIKEHGETTAVDYSEAHLVHYCYSNAYNPVLTPEHAQDGDTISHDFSETELLEYGGHAMLGGETFIRWRGVVPESYAPYKDLPIKNWSKIDPFAGDTVALNGWYEISMHNPDLIKSWIAERGAVSVAYYAGGDINVENNCYYFPTAHVENHTVMIVGWDDTFPRTYFNEYPEHDGAWLIRNSWGDNGFSEDGYFWISYDDANLGGSIDGVIAFEAAPKTADNNYYYDSNFHDWVVFSNPGANIFRINGNGKEELVSVGFLYETDDSGAGEASVAVYSGFDGSDPCAGTKLWEKTGIDLPYSGRYTIDVEEPVTLYMGEDIAVVVNIEGGYICQETDFLSWSGFEGRVSSNPGESFIYQSFTQKWEDLNSNRNNNGNLCISAQTKNVSSPDDKEYGPGYTPAPAKNTSETVSVKNNGSITINYMTAAEYAGKAIDPATDLSAKADLTKFFKKLPISAKAAASRIKASYVSIGEDPGSGSFYAKLTVNVKGLSADKQKALRNVVKKANKQLKKAACRFTINRRSLLHGRVVARADGSVSFTFPGQDYTITLPRDQYQLSAIPDDDTQLKITATEKKYTGTVVVPAMN